MPMMPILVAAIVLIFLALQFYPYFKLRASRGNAAPEPTGNAQTISKRMLYYFMSPSCGMCKSMTPIVDELASTRADIMRIDASEDPERAKSFKVMGTPAFVLVDNGVIEQVKLGGMSKKKILKMLDG